MDRRVETQFANMERRFEIQFAKVDSRFDRLLFMILGLVNHSHYSYSTTFSMGI